MMNFLIDKMVSELISIGLKNVNDKEIISRTTQKIKEFNNEFENSVLDGDAFNSFLNLDMTISRVFERIFSADKIISTDTEDFINEITNDSITFVNDRYNSIGRDKVKDLEIYRNYFTRMFKIMEQYRQEIQDFRQRAQVAQVVDVIVSENSRTRKLIESISKKEDNFFAEEKISEVKHLVNFYHYETALRLIEDILEEKQSLSIKQEIEVLFEKCRIYINKGEIDKLTKVKQKIEKLDHNSISLTDIDFYILLHNKEFEKFGKIKEEYIEKNATECFLMLKEIKYLFSMGDLELVRSKLSCNDEIIELLKNEYEARFIFGNILMYEGKYEQALSEFLEALKIENRVLCKLRVLLANATIKLNDRNKYYRQDLAIVEETRKEIEAFLSLSYLTPFISQEESELYWSMILNLAHNFDKDRFIEIFKLIPNERVNSVMIQSVLASYYISIEELANAKEILVKYWNYSEINILNYLIILSRESKWDDIIKLIELKSISEIENSTVLISYYLKAKCEKYGYNEIKADLVDKVNIFYRTIGLVFQFLELSLKNNDSVISNEIANIVIVNCDYYQPEELIFLTSMLITYRKEILVLEILKKRISSSSLLINNYIKALSLVEDYETKLENTKILLTLYSDGNKNEILLRYLSNFELNQNQFRKSLKIIDDYIKIYKLDLFASNIRVICKLKLKEFKGLEEEVELLLKSNDADYLQLLSIYKLEIGEIDESKILNLRSLYLKYGNFDSEFLEKAIILFFNSYAKNRKENKLKVSSDNTVTKLVSKNRVRFIAIHKDKLLKISTEGIQFNCENYYSDHSLSIILKLKAFKGKTIMLDDEEYKIEDIKDLYVFISNYCLEVQYQLSPESDALTQIRANDITEALNKIKSIMLPFNKQKNIDLENYNFADGIGRSISFLANNDITKYPLIIQELLHRDNQHFYSGELNVFENRKYVLTLSSIIILLEYNFQKVISNSKNKYYIPTNVYDSILHGAEKARVDADITTSIMNVNEEGKIYSRTITSEDKERIKLFWANLVEFINYSNVEVIEQDFDLGLLHNEVVNTCQEFDIASIQLCRDFSYILVCDDLFIRSIAKMLVENIESTNFVGFLISEQLINCINQNELINNLAKAGYLYPINHITILDLILNIKSIENLDDRVFEMNKLNGTLEKIFDSNSMEYYRSLLEQLVEYVVNSEKSKISVFELYEILKSPLKLKL